MKSVRSSLALKIVAVVLFVVSVASALLAALGLFFSYEFGIVNHTATSFYDTVINPDETRTIYWTIYEYMESARAQEVLARGIEQSKTELFNYHFAIYEQAEADKRTLLASSIEKDGSYGAVKGYYYVYERTEFEDHWDSQVYYSTVEDTSWVQSKLNEGHTVFFVEMAIKNPLPNHDSQLYFQSLVFHQVAAMGNWLVAMLIGAIVLFFASLIYLFCAAGHRKDTTEITANWIDKIPLDIYALLIAIIVGCILFFCSEIAGFEYYALQISLFSTGIILATLLGLSLLLSFATRAKLGKWWRNTITYYVLCVIKKYAFYLLRWVWTIFVKVVKWIFAFIGGFFKGLATIIRQMPLLWRSITICSVLLILLFALAYNSNYDGASAFFYFLLSCFILTAICLAVLQMRKLQAGGEALRDGSLDTKIDTQKMFWDFKRHAENLNSIGDGMAVAVEQRMKSERLKTELITNVSHDIKTPLTSIINYVDLLQKPHTKEEGTQYLEVLERQSARLKKLTEDLVEASKASTGNISAALTQLNAVEAVNQALGEYEARLEACSLSVVTDYSGDEMVVKADGRLLWRVLDNLLNNACKYALAGTRLYVQAERRGEYVQISLKNISRQQLNVTADELMERFVRGDSARSTEGSGLGLNIAKSLVELQNGTFSLNVDGDLFKAVITLPRG